MNISQGVLFECYFADLSIYNTRDSVHQRIHASADVSGSLSGRGAGDVSASTGEVQEARYLAVVHPIRSLTLRTQRNAMIAVVTATIVICLLNSPTLPDYGLYKHQVGVEERIACINKRLLSDETHYGFANRTCQLSALPIIINQSYTSCLSHFTLSPLILLLGLLILSFTLHVRCKVK